MPDYVIERCGVEIVCEVKQFETQAIRKLGKAAGGPVAVPPKLLFRTIRAQIAAAARQLRPLAERGIPLVVVLANPAKAAVLLEPQTLFHAMYGGGHWAVPGNTLPTIDNWPIPTAAGRDGALRTRHAYISAVAALRVIPDPRSVDAPESRRLGTLYLEVVEALNPRAIRLPDAIFDGADDARWAADEHRRYRQITGLQRPGVPEPEYADGFTWPNHSTS